MGFGVKVGKAQCLGRTSVNLKGRYIMYVLILYSGYMYVHICIVCASVHRYYSTCQVLCVRAEWYRICM
jgi:hypothetical protein